MATGNNGSSNWREMLADARHLADILVQETREGHVASEDLGQCVECFRMAVDALAGLAVVKAPQIVSGEVLREEVGPLCDLLRSVLARYQLPETVNQELRWLRAANRSLTL